MLLSLGVGRWSPVVRDLALFLSLWLVAAAVTMLACLPLCAYTLPIEDKLDVRASGVTETEQGDSRLFRWFHTHTTIELPGLNQTDYVLTLVAHDASAHRRRLQIAVNGATVFDGRLRGGWETLHVPLPRGQIDVAGERMLEFRTTPLQPGKPLGLAIERLTLKQQQAGPPSLNVLLNLLACLTLAALAMRVAGLSRRETAGLAGLSLLGLAAALALWRIPAATLLPVLAGTLAVGLAATTLVRAGGWRVWPAHQPWLPRVVVLALGLFVAHAAGMQVLRFIEIDHVARANHLLNIAQGDGARVQALLSNQHEWGIASVPYSLLSYYLLLPLAPFWPHPRDMALTLKIVVSLLDASVPLLLYGLVRATGGSGRAGWRAALFYAALPVTHLYFHDGSYPTIVGLWASVLALLALARLTRASGVWLTLAWWLAGTATLAGAMLMYVTQAAFLPVVIGGAGVGALALRPSRHDRAGPLLLAALAAALIVVVLAYYGRFVEPTLQMVLPRLLVGASLGHNAGALPGPLVGPFWLQAWGHVRWFPLGLMLAGLLALLGRRERLLGYLGLGYLALLIVMALVDLRFNMWNKHWYFALPAIALLAAYGCELLGRRGRAAQVAVAAALAYLLWTSAAAWAGRVFLYEWSLRTL